MTDKEILAQFKRGAEDAPTIAADQAATSAPIGISARQVFVIALLAIAGWQGVAAWVLTHNPDPADRAAILQSAINIALLAFGFYLGSSASSRNKDHRR